MSYPEEFKNKVVDAVKKGMSYRQVALKYNISAYIVFLWCKKKGVKSRFATQRSDETIINLIKKHKILTESEIKKKLGCTQLTKRLHTLIKKGRIKRLRISGKSKSALHTVLQEYCNRNLYYANEKDLKQWLIKKLSNLPPNLRRVVVYRFQSAGVKINQLDLKPSHPSIQVDKQVYEAIKTLAEKNNKTIKETTTELLQKGLKIYETIEYVKKRNPYPEKVFKEPTKQEWIKLQKTLQNTGLIQDRFFGSYGRRVWNNCIEILKETLEEK